MAFFLSYHFFFMSDVAVAGLPEPRQDRKWLGDRLFSSVPPGLVLIILFLSDAVAMAKFANDIMRKTHHLTRKLEVTLVRCIDA